MSITKVIGHLVIWLLVLFCVFGIVSEDNEETGYPTIEIQLHPGVIINGEAGVAYIIETTEDLESGIWLGEAIINMKTEKELWIDEEPISDTKQKFYRARPIKENK